MLRFPFKSFSAEPAVRCLAVVSAAALFFSLSLACGFVQWDDSLLTGKLAVRGFTADHLSGILVPRGAAYQPVRDLAFSLVYRFGGFDPFGYHLANFLLYLLAVALAVRTLEVLVRYAPGATDTFKSGAVWLGALLFALHPLHVEAVAWVQGNKDLLVTVFFLAAFLSYEKYARGEAGRPWYAASYVFFLLALASKPNAAAFPLVILAFDLTLGRGHLERSGGKLTARLWRRYLPYLLPALALAVYFIFFTEAFSAGRLGAENFLVLPQVLWDYYRLILVPAGLLHRYPDPEFTSALDPAFLAGLAVTVAIAVAGWRNRRRWPLTFFGLCWFYLCWLPHSNLAPIAIRLADRYVFLALLGVCLAAGEVFGRAVERRKAAGRGLVRLAGGTAAVCLLLGLLSARRCLDWKDGLTLWGRAVSAHPESEFFRLGQADAFIAAEQYDQAFAAYKAACWISPDDSRAWIGMGYIRKRQGRLQEATDCYESALAVDSTSFNALNSLGNINAQLGDDSLALEYYGRAREVDPGNYMVIFNLAQLNRRTGREGAADSLMGSLEGAALPQPVVLLRRGQDFIREGRIDSARQRFERAIGLDGNLSQAWEGLGEVLLLQDSAGRAIEALRAAAENSPGEWSLYNNLGLAFSRTGRPDSAAHYYTLAYRVQPDSAISTLNLAVLLQREGERARAIEILESFLAGHPDNFLALKNLGNWYAADSLNERAAGYYERALALDPQDANLHYNLGRLYIQFL
ncbi:MAG: tetratricopeptide repeat protein, partial [Candidatus Glassbacteria bacterium]